VEKVFYSGPSDESNNCMTKGQIKRPEPNGQGQAKYEMILKYNYFFIKCCVMLVSVMRFPRVKAQGRSFYHCISRFVHGLYVFGTSGGRCPEAEDFLSLMRRWAALTGIRIWKYTPVRLPTRFSDATLCKK
jgi:hypothetical protein